MPAVNRLKNWLKTRSPLSDAETANGAHASLACAEARHADVESAAPHVTEGEAAASEPQRSFLPPGFTPEMLHKLERRLVFVIGCARSGTTALTRALNCSADLLLLEEPNFFQNSYIGEFTEFFNRMHRSWGTPRMKGTYVRPPVEPEAGPLPLLARLTQDYRFVGAKLAFGPHDPDFTWPDAFVEYQARYFFNARRVIIMRTPIESIWSMHKMFADRPIPWLIKTWLCSAITCIDCYRVFPGVRWMFSEDLSAESVARFARTIPVEIEVPPTMLARGYVQSRVDDEELPEPLKPYASWCEGCLFVFRRLRENISSESLRYCGPQADWVFFDDIHRQIAATLADLPEN
jgi:hypothetical protein